LQGGIDLGFLNDRIILNATYAYNRSSNQLVGYVVPTSTGFKNITRNFPAIIQNTSWELSLQAAIVKNKSFTWSSSANLTIPRNKLVSFPNIEQTSYTSRFSYVVVGKPLGISQTMFHYGGVDPATGIYLAADADGNVIPPPGRPKNPDDYVVRLNTNTRFYGGFQNSFSYKGFQLDILFQFVRKLGPRDLYFNNGTPYSPGRVIDPFSNQPVSLIQNRWQKPDDEAVFAKYSTIGGPTNITGSEAYYSYAASYIRLKNTALSWQLPRRWIQKAHLQNARLMFQGQNLWTITKYTGLDPETMSLSTLPPLQMWTLGVSLEF
jgi:hypothetical protein